MKVEGYVITGVERKEALCRYKLIHDDREYEVISSGTQAIKDELFVRKGQHVEIEVEKEEKYLSPQKVKIILNDR